MSRKRMLGGIFLLVGAMAVGTAFLALRSASSQPELRGNAAAQADISCLETGTVKLRYIGGNEGRIKAQITQKGGTDYNYDLNNAGEWESFGLTEGDGEYTLRVLEHVEENRYIPVMEYELTLALADPASPFRESSQYIRFSPESAASALAEELTAGLETGEEKVRAVFEYVVEHISYDTEKTRTVEPGYLPDVDRVLEEGKGICFDYAAVMAAMLRSRGLACKMAVGYAGKQYHAWVEVLSDEGQWQLMDPTFVSANRNDQRVLDFVSDPENYKVRYYY